MMLLDIGRNDVGRVAQIGSVKVTEKMIIENDIIEIIIF